MITYKQLLESKDGYGNHVMMSQAQWDKLQKLILVELDRIGQESSIGRIESDGEERHSIEVHFQVVREA